MKLVTSVIASLSSVTLASLVTSIAVAAPASLQGSDTMAGIMTDAISAAGLEGEVTYVGGGSGLGEKAVSAGEQGIAPLSREVSPQAVAAAKAKGITLVPHVIGLDGVAVFVNAKNTLEKLDLPALRNIFTCSATKWEDVPGSGRTGAIAVFRRNDNSGTTDTFKSLVGIDAFGACVKALPETADIANATATNENALAYSGLTARRDGNKAVALAKAPGQAAVQPTAANIRSFAYPLARKLYVYEAKGGNVALSNAEATLLDKMLDRSFMDPIIQANEFFTVQ